MMESINSQLSWRNDEINWAFNKFSVAKIYWWFMRDILISSQNLPYKSIVWHRRAWFDIASYIYRVFYFRGDIFFLMLFFFCCFQMSSLLLCTHWAKSSILIVAFVILNRINCHNRIILSDNERLEKNCQRYVTSVGNSGIEIGARTLWMPRFWHQFLPPLILVLYIWHYCCCSVAYVIEVDKMTSTEVQLDIKSASRRTTHRNFLLVLKSSSPLNWTVETKRIQGTIDIVVRH